MTNDTLITLRGRRSIRKYSGKQVDDATLKTILEAGTYAPNGMGKQSPIIIAVQNVEDCASLRAMNAKIMGTDSDPYYGAPTILLVLAKRDHTTPVEDGCAVLTYMAVAAASLGLGTCWVNRERQMFDSDEGKALLQKWGITGDYLGIGALSLGYPDGEPAIRPPRKAGYITVVQ